MKKWALGFILIFVVGGNLMAEDFIPKDSVYLSESHWKEQSGKAIQLKSFKGQVVIMTMVYTGCEYSCPMTLKKLEQIEKDLLAAGVQRYRFVGASFDPKYDTPQALNKYMKKRKLSPEHWTFMTGVSDGDVREVAVLLGINYQREGKRDFSHSNGFVMLDDAGKIVAKLNGLNADHQELIAKLVEHDKQK